MTQQCRPMRVRETSSTWIRLVSLVHNSSCALHATNVSAQDFTERLVVTQQEDELSNTALICASLLGCSPVHPVVAIRLECLELYHQLRCRQSSFSVQAIVKVLCALQNVCI